MSFSLNKQHPVMSFPVESRSKNRHRQRGGSALEMALLLPWYAFLFVGVFDWGFYSHALISTQAAARSAALYTSTSSSTAADQATACIYARNELKVANNVSSTTTCTSSPLVVTATAVSGANSADGQPASQVTVSYQTLSLIPIPGLLGQQFWVSYTVQFRLRS
jgi:Flp pilus assembly protein TadG